MLRGVEAAEQPGRVKMDLFPPDQQPAPGPASVQIGNLRACRARDLLERVG